MITKMKQFENVLRYFDRVIYFAMIVSIFLPFIDLLQIQLGFTRGFPKSFIEDNNLLISTAFEVTMYFFIAYLISTLTLFGVECYNNRQLKDPQ